MQREEYDTSFIRHEMTVATDRIMSMPIGQRALLKTEEESRRLDFYERRVIEELGKHREEYELSRFERTGEVKFCGLVIRRVS